MMKSIILNKIVERLQSTNSRYILQLYEMVRVMQLTKVINSNYTRYLH